MLNTNAGILEGIRPQSIMPCTLRILKNLDHTSDDASIFNRPVETVEIVARAINYREAALRYEIDLQDHTATHTVSIFKKQGEATSKILRDFSYKENGYVRVVGNLRKNQDQMTLAITRVENIESRIAVDEHYSRLILAMTRLVKPLEKVKNHFADAYPDD